jgi:integrase/recombinase XerC
MPTATDFLRYLRFEKRYAAHTLTAYEKDLQQFIDYIQGTYGMDNVTGCTHFHIRSWLASLKEAGLSATTINRKLSSLQSFYKYLLRHGQIQKNPVRQLHALRTPGRLPVFMKETETAHLLEEQSFSEGFEGLTERLICELLYRTGMRRGELLQLKEQDVEWSLSQLRVLGKGGKERLIPVSKELTEIMRWYLDEKKQLPAYDSHHLLVLKNGQPLYAMYVYRVVKHYLALWTTLAKRSPHVLRHTFATHLLNNGANIQAIKELLGHSSLAATQVYTHNDIEKLKEIHKNSHPRG